MSENKNNDFLNDEEPIDLIEKNVESLRKKIQDLDLEERAAEASEDSVSIPTFSDEDKKNLDEIEESAKKKIADTFEDVKETATKVVNDNPKLKSSLDFIKENAMKAVELAKDKVAEFKNNPKVSEGLDKAGDSLQDFASVASEKAKEAASSIGEAIKPLKEDVEEFISKPEVKEKLEKVKETTTSAANKALETVSDFINSTKNKE